MLEDPRALRTKTSGTDAPPREAWRPEPLPLVGPGPQPCELRWERPIEGDGTGAVEIVCMAAGGRRLAIKGGDHSEMLATCGACTIPRETERRPCLFLVPFKTEREGRPRDYFACRWFYTLKPEDPWSTTGIMCPGCIYWFPRPPVQLFRDLEPMTQDVIRYHQDAWAGRLPPSPFAHWFTPRANPSLPRWRRLLHRVVSLVW